MRVSVRSLRLLWKRVTCDVHILDLTDPNQVSVDVLPSRDQVKVTYKVYQEFLTSRIIIIQVRNISVGQSGLTDIQATLSNYCTTSHQESIIITIINHPLQCESQYMTHDDFVNEAAREGPIFCC